MSRTQRLYLVLALAFNVVVATAVTRTAGVMPAIIVAGSMFGGLIGWSLTSLRHPSEPRRIVPVYLLTVAMLFFHIGEEYLYDFGTRIGHLTGSGWTEAQHVTQFVFVIPVFWMLGAIGLYFRHPLGNFMAWFIFAGMFLGEPTHLLVFPVLEGGRYHYFPGMWTALLPMVMGCWGLQVILSEHRQRRALASTS